MFSTNRMRLGAFSRIGDRYSHLIDRDHFLGRSAFETPWNASKRPLTNIIESQKAYRLELALPGFSKNEISVQLEGDVLKVNCKKKHLGRDKWSRQIRKEYGYQQISEGFTIPPDISKDDITSSYQHGVLTITLPIVKTAKKKIGITP